MLRTCHYCDSHHPAVYHCNDCDEDMCHSAKAMHLKGKITKDHNIVKLVFDTMESSSFPDINSRSICPIHLDFYRYYDEMCDCCLCRDCFALHHYGHKCISISEAMLRKRDNCEVTYHQGIKQNEEADELLREAKRRKEELDLSFQQQKHQIETLFQSIIHAVETRQILLLQQLDSVYSKFQMAYTQSEESLLETNSILFSFLENVKAALDKYPSSSVLTVADTSPTVSNVGDTSLEGINQAFSLFSDLKATEEGVFNNCNRDNNVLKHWIGSAMFHFVFDEKEVNLTVEKVCSLGKVIEGSVVAIESRAEGEGLLVYRDRETDFILTTYDSTGRKKRMDDISIALELGEQDEEGQKLSDVDRKVIAEVVDEGTGEYKISYHTVATGLKGKIPLHVKINQQDIHGSPFIVNFETSVANRFLFGVEITSFNFPELAKKSAVAQSATSMKETEPFSLSVRPRPRKKFENIRGKNRSKTAPTKSPSAISMVVGTGATVATTTRIPAPAPPFSFGSFSDATAKEDRSCFFSAHSGPFGSVSSVAAKEDRSGIFAAHPGPFGSFSGAAAKEAHSGPFGSVSGAAAKEDRSGVFAARSGPYGSFSGAAAKEDRSALLASDSGTPPTAVSMGVGTGAATSSVRGGTRFLRVVKKASF